MTWKLLLVKDQHETQNIILIHGMFMNPLCSKKQIDFRYGQDGKEKLKIIRGVRIICRYTLS